VFLDKEDFGSHRIGFVGYTIEDEEKVYQVSTNLEHFYIQRGAGDVETEQVHIPTPTEWEKCIAQIEEMLKNAGGGSGGISEESDPTVPQHVKNITEQNIENWNNKSSSGGTTNYNELENRPHINNIQLDGNKTLEELGIQAKGNYVDEEYVINAINEALNTEEDVGDGSISSDKITVSSEEIFQYNDKNLYQLTWGSNKYEFFEIDDNNLTFTCEMDNGTATVLWLIVGKTANGNYIIARLNQLTGENSNLWGIATVNSLTRVSIKTPEANSTDDVFVTGDKAYVYYDDNGVHILKNEVEVLYIAFSDYSITQPLLGFVAYYAMGSATQRLMVSDLGHKSNVDLKTVDLFIFAGQSNMAGRGQGANAPKVDTKAGVEFRAITDPTQLYEIDESIIPFGRDENKDGGISDTGSDGALKKSGSLVPAFINSYYEKTGTRVVAISASEGSTTSKMWVKEDEGLYSDLINRWNTAETWLTENGYTIRRRLMFWLQGEGDAANSVSEETYIERMNTLLNTLILPKTTIEKCMVIRIGHRNTTDVDYDYIMKAQNELCRTVDNTIMVSIKLGEFVDLSYYNANDTTHFNQTSLNLLGEDAGKNTAEYVNTGLYPILNDNLTGSILYGKSYNDRKTKEYIDGLVGDIETLLGGV